MSATFDWVNCGTLVGPSRCFCGDCERAILQRDATTLRQRMTPRESDERETGGK